jgi:hypothetical protein
MAGRWDFCGPGKQILIEIGQEKNPIEIARNSFFTYQWH